MVKLVEPSATFIDCTPDIEKVIEYACRTCYKSHDYIKYDSAEKLFNQVVKQKHHDSVSEHGSITFQLVTDRSMLAQISRHRVGVSLSVESQRYCNYSKEKFGSEVKFIKPHDIVDQSTEYGQWLQAMMYAEGVYFDLLAMKVRPETARSVLPNSTCVEMTVTMNVRSMRNFFKLRAEGHAQSDIQHLCKLIHECVIGSGKVPAYLFSDIMN